MLLYNTSNETLMEAKLRNWLIEKRIEKKLSQEQVAIHASVTREYISMIELGKRDPSVKVAKLIAKQLCFDWKYFFENNVT